MMQTITIIAAALVSAIYVRRVDALTWREHPWLMFVHAIGGTCAVGVLCMTVAGEPGMAWRVLTLLCTVGILAMTAHQLPDAQARQRAHVFDSGLMVSAQIISRRDDSRLD